VLNDITLRDHAVADLGVSPQLLAGALTESDKFHNGLNERAFDLQLHKVTPSGSRPSADLPGATHKGAG
jgi:hypothetical protein